MRPPAPVSSLIPDTCICRRADGDYWASYQAATREPTYSIHGARSSPCCGGTSRATPRHRSPCLAYHPELGYSLRAALFTRRRLILGDDDAHANDGQSCGDWELAAAYGLAPYSPLLADSLVVAEEEGEGSEYDYDFDYDYSEDDEGEDSEEYDDLLPYYHQREERTLCLVTGSVRVSTGIERSDGEVNSPREPGVGACNYSFTAATAEGAWSSQGHSPSRMDGEVDMMGHEEEEEEEEEADYLADSVQGTFQEQLYLAAKRRMAKKSRAEHSHHQEEQSTTGVVGGFQAELTKVTKRLLRRDAKAGAS